MPRRKTTPVQPAPVPTAEPAKKPAKKKKVVRRVPIARTGIIHHDPDTAGIESLRDDAKSGP